jgi:16S rRNA (guanine966-N2)-methyltransferase
MALRVVAGEAGGRRLVAPPSARPTSDRVREALFSTLGDRVDGAVVLDLYAGSGALAIEALSRGAVEAWLVDHDREAEAACEQNLATTGFADRAHVLRTTIEPSFFKVPLVRFDLVFCDPPYSMPDDEVADVLGALRSDGRWLAASGGVVVEREGPEWVSPSGWSVSWQRKYGDTLVTILHVES